MTFYVFFEWLTTFSRTMDADNCAAAAAVHSCNIGRPLSPHIRREESIEISLYLLG